MEEANVQAIQRGYCVQQAKKMVLKLTLSKLDVAEGIAEKKLGVGLDGLCRAVAEYDGVLGYGGWNLLRQARRALRDWCKLDNVDCLSFDVQEAYEQVSQRLPR